MGRTRIKEAPVYKTWNDVDNALKEIAQAELDLLDIEGELNKQINGAKAAAAQEAKPLQDRIDVLGKDIKAFVDEHRDELEGKTKQLIFGKTGYRKSTKVIIPKAKDKLAAIIKNLKARKMTDCIVVKETVNKEAIKKYSADDIARAGMVLKQEDVFWFETDKERLAIEQNRGA